VPPLDLTMPTGTAARRDLADRNWGTTRSDGKSLNSAASTALVAASPGERRVVLASSDGASNAWMKEVGPGPRRGKKRDAAVDTSDGDTS
jgi:hypothetical protein